MATKVLRSIPSPEGRSREARTLALSGLDAKARAARLAAEVRVESLVEALDAAQVSARVREQAMRDRDRQLQTIHDQANADMARIERLRKALEVAVGPEESARAFDRAFGVAPVDAPEELSRERWVAP